MVNVTNVNNGGLTMPKLNDFEYQYLKGKWDGPAGAAFNAVGEFCYEEGWTDHFGFVTPKGHKAISDYESNLSIGRLQEAE